VRLSVPEHLRVRLHPDRDRVDRIHRRAGNSRRVIDHRKPLSQLCFPRGLLVHVDVLHSSLEQVAQFATSDVEDSLVGEPKDSLCGLEEFIRGAVAKPTISMRVSGEHEPSCPEAEHEVPGDPIDVSLRGTQ
jgi:hypothetical protein